MTSEAKPTSQIRALKRVIDEVFDVQEGRKKIRLDDIPAAEKHVLQLLSQPKALNTTYKFFPDELRAFASLLRDQSILTDTSWTIELQLLTYLDICAVDKPLSVLAMNFHLTPDSLSRNFDVVVNAISKLNLTQFVEDKQTLKSKKKGKKRSTAVLNQRFYLLKNNPNKVHDDSIIVESLFKVVDFLSSYRKQKKTKRHSVTSSTVISNQASPLSSTSQYSDLSSPIEYSNNSSSDLSSPIEFIPFNTELTSPVNCNFLTSDSSSFYNYSTFEPQLISSENQYSSYINTPNSTSFPEDSAFSSQLGSASVPNELIFPNILNFTDTGDSLDLSPFTEVVNCDFSFDVPHSSNILFNDVPITSISDDPLMTFFAV